MNAFANEGTWGGESFVHGGLAWRDYYLGWRINYGPMCYGMKDYVRRNIENNARLGFIKDGPDAGAVMDQFERQPNGTVTYGMYEVFLDMARQYYEYAPDEDFAEMMIPVLKGCIERAKRRLLPGEEMLFESSLNTWISDSHWYRMGQCTTSSAYMYNAYRFLERLLKDSEEASYYKQEAQRIRDDANRILWQPKEGVFAEAKDTLGYKMLHGQAELATIYHSSKFGLADDMQIYQMLDWIERSLPYEITDNGGRMYWNSNWFPNDGRSFSHSTFFIEPGETFNTALIYQRLGLADEGYELIKSAYMTVFGGRNPGVHAVDMERAEARCGYKIIRETPGGLSANITINGTQRGNVEFADCTSMFGRAVFEGVFGILPRLDEGRIEVCPCIPSEINNASITSKYFSYTFERVADRINFTFTLPEIVNLRLIFCLPPAIVSSATLDGADLDYTMEDGFGMVRVVMQLADILTGKICLNYKPVCGINPKDTRVITAGESLSLQYENETVVGYDDPQGLLVEPREGVLFLHMNAQGARYIKPVKLRMKKTSRELWKPVADEFAEPHKWSMIDMDELFNAASPDEVLRVVPAKTPPPPMPYNQVNHWYWSAHYLERCADFVDIPSDERWRDMVGDDGVAMTGEGIPFRSKREGNYMAMASLTGSAYTDQIRINCPGVKGRAIYMLVTGITFPMQSHVENVRITLVYKSGVRDEHRLVNPFDIGDTWSTLWERWHDTARNGFESLGGRTGADSSAGLDLTKPIKTDTEAHIMRFLMRANDELSYIEFRIIANDVAFGVMGVTVLE